MSQNQVLQNHTSQDHPHKETMKAVVYEGNGILRLEERPIPHIMTPRDAVVRVTLTTICSSDIHILHGAVPRAVPGTILGHEVVGIVEEAGSEVTRATGLPSMWRPSAGSAFTASAAMSITVLMSMAAGLSAAGSTEVSRSTSAFHLQTTASRRFPIL